MSYKGNYKLQINNKVIVEAVSGVWSATTARHHAKDMRTTVETFNGEPYAHLMLLDNWQLGTPEMEPVSIELIAWMYKQNIRRTALVYDDNVLKSYQLDKMFIKKKGLFECRYFNRIEDAVGWLEENGFPLSTPLNID